MTDKAQEIAHEAICGCSETSPNGGTHTHLRWQQILNLAARIAEYGERRFQAGIGYGQEAELRFMRATLAARGEK